ncbi:MAG: FixH family protein [Phycisphaerales bacterium]
MTDPKHDKRTFFERGLHWPVGLVCMFLVSASFVLTTAIFGAGKGSRAIEPDYYARSVDWDSEKARLNTADKLGWDVRISASPKLDPYANRFVSVMLLDAIDQPIEGALIELVAFSQANAHDPLSKVLPNSGAGQYQAKIAGMHTPGLWEFRISIRHAGHQALLIKSLDLKDD